MHIDTTGSRKSSLFFGIATAVLVVTGCTNTDPQAVGSADAVEQALVQAGAPASANKHRHKPKPHHHDCQPENDPATPGDDRAGYVQCGDTVTCGPDTGGCCILLDVCGVENVGCPNPSPMVSCDGPEDCTTPGQRCWIGMLAPACAEFGPALKCHTGDDCTEPGRPVCNSNGSCVEM